MYNVSKDTKVIRGANAAPAGQTPINTTIVDCYGFDAACAIALLNTVTGGCQLSLQLQDNTANQAGGMSQTGNAASYNDSAGESSNTLLVTDVINVCGATGKRYLRAQLTRYAQNAAVDGIIIILYRTRPKPTTQDASVIALALSNAAS